MEEIILRSAEFKFTNKELEKATKEISALGDKIRESYFKVAAKIAAVDSAECYKEDGFGSVHDWTEAVFGWKKTRSYELLNIGREWTTTITDKNGKLVGYCSDLNPGYSTSQVAAMLPAGHALASDLNASGKITPEMPVKKIKAVIAAEMKTDEETASEDTAAEEETDTEDTAENDPLIRVTDEEGTEYEIPASVLMQYKL